MIVSVAVGLAGIGVAWAIYFAKRVKAPQPVKLFEQKFYWDELYDVVLYRGSDLLSRGLYAFVERPLIAGSISEVSSGFGLGSRELVACAERPRPHVRARARERGRHPRRRLPGGSLVDSWLTTILILLPLAGALLVAVAPLPRTGSARSPR